MSLSLKRSRDSHPRKVDGEESIFGLHAIKATHRDGERRGREKKRPRERESLHFVSPRASSALLHSLTSKVFVPSQGGNRGEGGGSFLAEVTVEGRRAEDNKTRKKPKLLSLFAQTRTAFSHTNGPLKGRGPLRCRELHSIERTRGRACSKGGFAARFAVRDRSRSNVCGTAFFIGLAKSDVAQRSAFSSLHSLGKADVDERETSVVPGGRGVCPLIDRSHNENSFFLSLH